MGEGRRRLPSREVAHMGGGWCGPWDRCVGIIFGIGGCRAGSERAPGVPGRVGGEPAWKEMEEGAPGLPFPPTVPPRGSGVERARVLLRPVGQTAGGRASPEGGLGGSGAAARAERR